MHSKMHQMTSLVFGRFQSGGYIAFTLNFKHANVETHQKRVREDASNVFLPDSDGSGR